MTVRTTKTAKESGHWYARDKDGLPTQIVDLIGKNGKRRRPTLADARSRDWVPGVTTLMRAAGVPEQLVRWRVNQAVLAALTLPRLEDETEEDWLGRLDKDMNATAKSAAEEGSEVHKALELFFNKSQTSLPFVDVSQDDVLRKYSGRCIAAFFELDDAGFGDELWEPERTVIHSLGFGTRSDLHSSKVCLDWKTKDGDAMPDRIYDDHAIQLAATRKALEYTCGYPEGSQRAGIVYVSRTHDVAKWVEATPEQLDKGWSLFRHLVGYWYEKTLHKPSWRDAGVEG